MQVNNIQGPKAPPPPPPKPKEALKQGEAVQKAVKMAKQAVMADQMKGHALVGAFGEAAAMTGKRKPVATLPGLPVGVLRIAANTRASLALAANGVSSLRSIFTPQSLKAVPALSGLNRAAGIAGGVLAPFQVADGIAAGGRGIQSIRDGNYVLGGAELAQGGASIAAGAAGLAGGARVLGIAGRFSSAFGAAGRLAGPIGGVAAGIAGGIDVYKGLTSDPPNYRQAALGGANVVGGGLLAAGAFFPPLAVAGGLVLLGTAVVQNWDAIKDGAAAAGRAIGDAAEKVGGAVVDAAQEVGEAVADTADKVVDTAKAVGGAVADGVKSVGKFLGGL